MDNTPTRVLSYLQHHHAKPLKRLSQNFLIDKNIIKKIIESIDITENDVILEIGPGIGALTYEIAQKNPLFIAVEKDRLFAKNLKQDFIDNNKITIYEDDFLKFPLEETLKPLIKRKKAKVIANLPYNITSPIIAKLLQYHYLFSEMRLMVQYEPAVRLTSSPDSKNYGSFTIFTNFYADVKLLFKISPGSFLPRPKVTSALISLKLKEKIPSDNIDFHSFVRQLFQKRRKKITSVLKEQYDNKIIQEVFSILKINPNARPENLTTPMFYSLFLKLKNF